MEAEHAWGLQNEEVVEALSVGEAWIVSVGLLVLVAWVVGAWVVVVWVVEWVVASAPQMRSVGTIHSPTQCQGVAAETCRVIIT